jgi:hypothetical protein
MPGAFFVFRSPVAESYSVQLDRVQAAIGAIESGNQSYTIQNRTFTKADLGLLYNRERFLRGQVAKQAAGGIRVQRVVPL